MRITSTHVMRKDLRERKLEKSGEYKEEVKCRGGRPGRASYSFVTEAVVEGHREGVCGYPSTAFLIRTAASCGSTPSVYQSKSVR
jgi:hypothetical protein